MKILTTYENALPIAQADAEVVVNTAAALARRGHDVTIASPAGSTADGDEAAIREYYGVRGPLRFAVQKTPAWSKLLGSAASGDLERGRQHITQAITLPHTKLAKDSDFLYTRHILLAVHALRAGRRVFFDHYRPWGDQVPPIQPLIRAMIGHPRFVGMVTHSAVAKRAYLRLGVPEERIRVQHNGYDEARVEPRLSVAEARAITGLPKDKSIVTYTGRINEKKGLDMVLDMARALPGVVFVLVGSEGRGVIEQAAEPLENVHIVGWQSFSGTMPYLFSADMLIIPPSSAPMAQYGSTVLPLKVFLYLAAGRTIIAGRTPDIEEVLHDDNALLLEPGNTAAAIAAIDALSKDKARMNRLSEGSLMTAASLTWDARAERIEAFLEELLGLPELPMTDRWSGTEWLSESAEWLACGVRTNQWIQGKKA